MKQLFTYTSTLLCTTLLLGALMILNIQLAQAQTAEQLAVMPDAFETIENPNTIIGDGQYYYIQFYIEDTFRSYLTDCGVSMKAKTKDFLPSGNRQWTLEAAGDGDNTHFKLRSKEGHYLKYVGGLENLATSQYRFGCVEGAANATIMTCQKNGDYYFLLDATKTESNLLIRGGNLEWATDLTVDKYDNARRPYGRMRFVKLKSSNVAYILYYRGEEETDGAGNTNADAASSRHYLTYSGLNTSSDNWTSVITNGGFNDDDVDLSCFYWKINNGPIQHPTLSPGVQGSGITITSEAGQTYPWDTQFFIKTNEPLPEGTRYHVAFNYRANHDVTISTQAQGEPGTYHWSGIGDVYFSGGARTDFYGTITAEMARDDGMQTIAFNLGMTGEQPTTTFDIDEITFEIIRTSDVSNRTSILYTNDAWKLPTAAAYHQDGLWELEETGTDGQFYIKKYGATDEYLNCWPIQPDVRGLSLLGTKDEKYGKYVLDDPNANRYTRVQNVKTTEMTALTTAMFYIWDGVDANAKRTRWVNTDYFLGQERYGGNTVIGDGNVYYHTYADLTGCSKIVLEGTQGTQVRVLFNRQTDGGSDFIELTPTIGDDGKAEVNLSSYSYVHLHAIKIANGSSGTINSVTLGKEGVRFLSHYNTGDHEGKMVMQYGNGNNNILIGFRPVEVPVPNKDEFYQVLLQLKSNNAQMVDYNGGAIGYDNSLEGRKLFKLEQVDDYSQFRIKNPSGQYLRPYPTPGGVTEANNPEGADVISNLTLINEKFNLEWFFVDPNAVPKEIPMDGYYVTHRQSYLNQYAINYVNQVSDHDKQLEKHYDLERQGLASESQSEWWNFDGNGIDGEGTQKVNHFEITHYVKRNSSIVVEFPTVLHSNNDHIYFQRFYKYGESDLNMDIANLKAHVSLDTRDDGDVQYFLYNNGMVTGQKLDWAGIERGSYARNVQRRFNFTNSDGQPFTVAIDVSRYSDMTYKNDGNLEEPSLTMRYLYHMNDAKDMAERLTAKTEQPENDVNDDNWLESKVFHFPSKQIFYEDQKMVGYRGEFIALHHLFSDYWVFDGAHDDDHLVSAVNNANEGKIEVEIYDPNTTGIRLGGWNPTINGQRFVTDDSDPNNVKYENIGLRRLNLDDVTGDYENDYRGYYFYDKMYNRTSYGDSRFLVFRYPANGEVAEAKTGKPVYIRAYLNNNGTRYQIAQFTVIFDKNSETLPWMSVNGSGEVKGTVRDPKNLRAKAGKPIAKVTFDYPTGETYHYPDNSGTRHNGWNDQSGTIDDCSPLPLTFDKTNYAFDGEGCNWGSYALVSFMSTRYGNQQEALPANTKNTKEGTEGVPLGYGVDPDNGMQDGFLYIDASEQPGDICAAHFEGEFCPSDHLMCSGWISGSNRADGTNDIRCAGGITLTVKGEDENGNTKAIYRFCPGQCYELDNGDGPDGRKKENGADWESGCLQVVWQQFYFEFTSDKKYKRYWLEVNNNCVSSNGGDFMLDNIEVYAVVPEVKPDINTPLCVSVGEDGKTVTEMRLLKLSIDHNKLKASVELNGAEYADEGIVFLEKEKFLKTFKTELAKLNNDELEALNLGAFINNKFSTITLDELALAIEKDELSSVPTDEGSAYKIAFDEAILGEKTTWHSYEPTKYPNSSIMYFRWYTNLNDPRMPKYTFADAVNKLHAVYHETVIGEEGEENYVVMNGNYSGLNWKTNTDYYVINTATPIGEGTYDDQGNYIPVNPCDAFNLCSECCRASTFRIEPPYTVLGLESSETTNDYVVCEGQIPTIALNQKGYDLKGEEVDMTGINYDWWMGDPDYTETETDGEGNEKEVRPKLATLENYHTQHKVMTYKDTNGATQTEDVKLDKALSTLRTYYPAVTSLDGIEKEVEISPDPKLTLGMIKYLKELVDAGELVLHQTSVSVPAEPISGDDPYFYLVACPIHDGYFDKALNVGKNEYVTYFCDEPQGLRIKVGQKAPTLKTGFVPGENTFDEYNYPTDSDPILSIRLAKNAQFMEVRHGSVSDNPADNYNTRADEDKHFLWLPIRNAMTETASGVIRKSADCNIYLASTNDPVWDKKIAEEMNQNGKLPVFGKIVNLYAKNTKGANETETESLIAGQNDVNHLCIYFVEYEDEEYNVREGYNYTLSLPFQEEGDVNTCDGTILINLKIVPDYEVWTGAAGNTDWNNDENWRRADGNPGSGTSTSELNNDELYVGVATDGSPLKDYTTNRTNYRTPKDRLLRKGFAPLYCTHVLIKSNEWGDAPVLYDAIDIDNGNTKLNKSPFPNLRDGDGWDGTSEAAEPTKATATPILRYDMQARLFDIWEETYGENSIPTYLKNGTTRVNKGRKGDLLAEMYQINSCDEIAFQPGTELMNAHLLNYNTAWVEYQLDNKRWYLLGSPLQGTISGEWYAPKKTAQQKTTYYDPITFIATDYDRYNPAIYQRGWDKAKAVLYEVGSEYSTNDDSQTDTNEEGTWVNNGTTDNPIWQWQSPDGGADEYLDRLGYKPMGGNKANVAIKGIWSNTYNDATVDYSNGAFSVMSMNHLKGTANDKSDDITIVRLPKEDEIYKYWTFDQDINGTETNITHDDGLQEMKGRALNRGRLKTDKLLPTQTGVQRTEDTDDKFGDLRYGVERTITRIPIKETPLKNMINGIGNHTETISAGESSLGYYLVENPFPCGLDMKEFFKANDGLEKKYWLLVSSGQQLVQWATTGWVTPTIPVYPNDDDTQDPTGYNFTTANGVVAPGQGFFVTVASELSASSPLSVKFNKDMQAKTRYGVQSGSPRTFTIEVGMKQKMTTTTISVDDDDDPDTPDISVEVEVPEVDPSTGEYVLAPITQDVTIYSYDQTSDPDYQYLLKARTRGEEANMLGLVITAERDKNQSSALVMQREQASNDFLPSEDTETFITSDLEHVPTVYTLCGRLATTINSIHDFRSLPIGVESNSDAPCTLTFKGVEMLGDSIAFYDALEQKLTPLKSGMTVSVSGQTQNRYYLVRSLIKEEAAAETHLQIFTEGLTAKVIASTAEPITSVRCYDTAGRLIHSASPQTPEYSFSLPIAGVYIINAETENDRKTIKLMAK